MLCLKTFFSPRLVSSPLSLVIPTRERSEAGGICFPIPELHPVHFSFRQFANLCDLCGQKLFGPFVIKKHLPP
jgi:hypothetical protein